MRIVEVTENKKQYLDLLLLADEQEDMVDRYLYKGKMYVLDDDGVKCECVVTDEGNGILEIKNIATVPPFQRKGYANALIEFLVEKYRRQFSILQVGTGDSPLTIPFYEKCGFVRSHMVIETVYDTLAERYKSISLGQSKSSMITTISDVQSTVDKVESTVGRFPKLLQTAIGKATGLITGQSGGYVVINTDSESGQPYELLILDAPSIDEAVNVWRWNVGGLGFSHNGYNGPYETAITADGQIVADFITSGSLVANIIKAGVIQSQDGSSWWDLESGEVVLRAYATSKEVTEVSDRITTIEEQKMLRLVIISSNGNIFKNGNVKTLLSAKVYSWDEDITDTLDANQFVWTRVSEDTEADKVWNEQHFGGAKSVVITGADVKVRATFYCDLIDTTTRQSLL